MKPNPLIPFAHWRGGLKHVEASHLDVFGVFGFLSRCCRLEILPWCELPSHMPAGSSVKATQHLMSPCAIIVHAGTKGTILGGVDQSLVFVSFENGPAVAAAINTLEQLEEHEKLEPEDVNRVKQRHPNVWYSENSHFWCFGENDL